MENAVLGEPAVIDNHLGPVFNGQVFELRQESPLDRQYVAVTEDGADFQRDVSSIAALALGFRQCGVGEGVPGDDGQEERMFRRGWVGGQVQSDVAGQGDDNHAAPP